MLICKELTCFEILEFTRVKVGANMDNLLLRIVLLGGLVLHKIVWEVMKRLRPTAGNPIREVPLRVKLVKAVKVGILAGICLQTLLPDVFPITQEPETIRAIGATMFIAGLAVALIGRIQLGLNWSDIEVAGVKREQSVVSQGIYRFIRHPIYVGDLILLIGFELALNSWLVLGAVALIPIVLKQALREEEMLCQSLTGYEQYRARTKAFIPFVM